MKNIIPILLITFFPLQSFAFEDYIIMSDYNVIKVSSSDTNIASVNPLYNIDNNKNILLLKSQNEGKTILTIESDKGEIFIDVEVTKDKTIIPQTEGLTYYVLDIPSMSKEQENSSETILQKEPEEQREKPILRGE